MSTTLFWVIAAVCGILTLICLGAFMDNRAQPAKPSGPEPLPSPETETELPAPPPIVDSADDRPTSGPHTVVARGEVDEGVFLLVRTPLWDYPFNRALFTQVFFDDVGAMCRARYCPVDTVQAGKLEVGSRDVSPVTVTVGTGAAVAQFPTSPETTWTH